MKTCLCFVMHGMGCIEEIIYIDDQWTTEDEMLDSFSKVSLAGSQPHAVYGPPLSLYISLIAAVDHLISID